MRTRKYCGLKVMKFTPGLDLFDYSASFARQIKFSWLLPCLFLVLRISHRNYAFWIMLFFDKDVRVVVTLKFFCSAYLAFTVSFWEKTNQQKKKTQIFKLQLHFSFVHFSFLFQFGPKVLAKTLISQKVVIKLIAKAHIHLFLKLRQYSNTVAINST